jgi:hypothetical protein
MVPAQYLRGGQRGGLQHVSVGRDSRAYRSPTSSPGDVQENDALGFQVLNLGGQVRSVTLEVGTGE